MVRRFVSLVLLIWALGFLAFAVTLPKPAGDTKTDGVIVLTGGEGRIAQGLEVLRRHQAQRLLVSGVDSEVKPQEFIVKYQVEAGLMRCCITLGYESVDTRSNATEAANWIAANRLESVRLVTSDWHMRRAAFELRRTIPASVTLIEDGVTTRPSLNTLFMEYSKLLARRIAQVIKAMRGMMA